MATEDKLLQLIRQLWPFGRAYQYPYEGTIYKLMRALAKSFADPLDAALGIRDTLLPDNDNFSTDDATDWERRLGLATNSSVSLADRKMAIARKMAYPNDQQDRLHENFLEYQLQQAGFDVYVYRNRFSDGGGGWVTKTPQEILGAAPAGAAFHAPTVRHGNIRHGGLYKHFVVNNLDQEIDSQFVIGPDYRNTFYVAGATVDSFADVPLNRKREFRQLLLTLKPVNMVGILFVNYT